MSFKEVYAAYPAYKKGVGNVVCEVREDGYHIVSQCFTTYKRHWAKSYGREWDQVIHEAEAVVDKKSNHVVLLSEECSLIPAKLNTPMFKDDGANGYVQAERIKRIEEGKKGTRIVFVNDIEIITSTHKKTINKDLKRARALRNDYLLRNMRFMEKVLQEHYLNGRKVI